jgi:hypothetical protein
MSVAVEYLVKARQELLDERARVEREIRVLEEVIDRLRVEQPATASTNAVPATVPVSKARSVKEIALEVASRGDLFSLTEVVEAAKREGSPAKYESISSVVSRLSSEGVLERGPRRGTYVLKKPEPPDLSGDSVLQTDTSAPTDDPLAEGATDDGDHRDTRPPIED